jgi:hypothetical protein
MRRMLALSVLVPSLVLGLSVSAEAARGYHRDARHEARHFNVRRSHAAAPRYLVPPVVYDDTPSYNDPSKYGGGAP